MPEIVDIIGRRFGKLTVIGETNTDRWGAQRWICKCICNKIKIISENNLRSGMTKSCGCLKVKHGHTIKGAQSKTYQSWRDMKQRCTNPRNKRYKDYGGRGITVCGRWLKFANFLEDIGECPKGYSLDRIKNNLGYCKENCRWATRQEQQRNKRNNILLTYNSKTLLLIDWAKQFNIHPQTLMHRIQVLCWSPDKALTTPVRASRS